jgi:hypothetical protein
MIPAMRCHRPGDSQASEFAIHIHMHKDLNLEKQRGKRKRRSSCVGDLGLLANFFHI